MAPIIHAPMTKRTGPVTLHHRYVDGPRKEVTMRNKVVTVAAAVLLVNLAACATPRSTRSAEADEPAAAVTATPVVETTTATEAAAIPFESTTVPDSTLDTGKTVVRTAGVNGVKTMTYQLTYRDGALIDKKLISEAVTTPPVTQVTAVGTKVQAPPPPASNCDPNYTGACVPIASDVDCAGGGGDGPAYVRGPVYVVGTDIYDLDRDNDGIGCE